MKTDAKILLSAAFAGLLFLAAPAAASPMTFHFQGEGGELVGSEIDTAQSRLNELNFVSGAFQFDARRLVNEIVDDILNRGASGEDADFTTSVDGTLSIDGVKTALPNQRVDFSYRFPFSTDAFSFDSPRFGGFTFSTSASNGSSPAGSLRANLALSRSLTPSLSGGQTPQTRSALSAAILNALLETDLTDDTLVSLSLEEVGGETGGSVTRSFDITNAEVRITPIPATLPLLLTAILVIPVVRRLRSAARA